MWIYKKGGTELINVLCRIFVKNYKDTKNPKVRLEYGIFAGIVGIICNIVLFLTKLTAGFLTSSLSIMADAINNLSDAGSSIVTLAGFKLASKPADSEHPYGHGRIEYISGFIVSMLIIVMGVELLRSSVEKIFNPQPLEFSFISIIILIFSILLKMWMAKFNKRLGDKVDSAAMKATATDSLSDCISTTVVLFGVLITQFSNADIDGYAGAFVALFVIIAGFKAAKETLSPLLGQPPSKEFVKELERLILEDEHIIGVHDLIVHNYGPGRVFVSVHAEVPADMDILVAHDCVDMAERRIEKRMGCFISIHMDPVITDDEVINEQKAVVQEIIDDISPDISMHDFRTIKGPHITNLIFDVLVPFGFNMKDDEIVGRIKDALRNKHENWRAVIQVDKKMF